MTMDWTADLLYNSSMPLPRVARMFPLKTVGPSLPNLGRLLPPDLVVGLLQRVSTISDHPRQVASQLITRSGYRLRELQHMLPALRISPRKLLKTRRRRGKEAALIQALVEFYVGLILLILFPGRPRARYPQPGLLEVFLPRLALPRAFGRARPVIPH
jgi:hypothetical protein